MASFRILEIKVRIRFLESFSKKKGTRWGFWSGPGCTGTYQHAHKLLMLCQTTGIQPVKPIENS
jgi:hypothetical protein